MSEARYVNANMLRRAEMLKNKAGLGKGKGDRFIFPMEK